jgi:tetratricopeptide (TPR) repeat protein
MLGAIAFGLLSKEHAVIAVGLLWLDERAVPLEGARLPARSYVMVVGLTLLWLLARRAVEGGLSFAAVAPTFFGLDAAGRVATMLPAVFVVLRLLLWPWDLSPDYHPEVIDRQEHLTLTGLGGLVVLAALVSLAVALWRRHRPWSLGILLIGLAWLPTSNLLFPTGIAMAERTLYASTIGLTLIAALAADALARRAAGRTALPVVALGAVLVPCALKVVDQVPLWETTRSLVIRALVTHPESYKVHQAAARVFWRLGDRHSAMREYALAAELYPHDHFLLTEIASAALEIGQARRSLQYSAMSERLDADYSLTHQLRAHALLVLGQAHPALAEARLAVVKGPVSAEAARLLVASYLSLGQPDSARAVWPAFGRRGGSRFDRWLLGALTYATVGMPDSAALALDSAADMLPADTIALRRLREARDVVSRPAGRR